jgi:hypothetical protein
MGKHRRRIFGKEVEAIIGELRGSRTHRPEQMFGDWVECAAIAVSNKYDLQNYESREARYMEIVKGYERDDLDRFARCLGELTLYHAHGPRGDAMGEIWAGLELKGEWFGQFFTPYSLSHMMAKMAFQDCNQLIRENGFITAQEPACGPGGMIVAMANAIEDMGHDYSEAIHVTGIDIDRRCVHMSYLQTSLLGIPAVIYRGDTLRATIHDAWYTPAHIIGGWRRKLHNHDKRHTLLPFWQGMALPERIELLQAQQLPEEQAMYDGVPHTVDPSALALLAAE